MLSRFGKRVYQFYSILIFGLILTISISAQSESGSASLEGTIKDSAGAVVQGATISIKNNEIGLERTAISDSNGNFTVSVLPVGSYTVTTRATGFTEFPITVRLTVGETTPLNVVLAPQGSTILVDVNADSEVVDTEESATGSSISQRAVQDLPIRGRNFVEFVQLSPAVVQEGDRGGLVVAGQRSINSNVAIDGADFNDALQGNQRGGNEAVFFFPQTAIREFQVVRSGATAEVGRTNAGFVNAVTKSGTNDFRGETFYYNRNSRLTSPDAFGNKGENNQNQFGGSIGGPIVRDKAFFFFGIEQNYLRLPYFIQFGRNPAITLPQSLLAFEGEQTISNDPTSLFGRTDFVLSQNNSLNIQYLFSRLEGNNFENYTNASALSDRAVQNNYTRKSNSNGLKGSLVSVLNSDLVNEFRGQIATDNRDEVPNSNLPETRIAGIGRQAATSLSSDGRIGGDNSRPRLFNTLRYQIADNLSYNLSKHKMKFGFDLNINQLEQQRENNVQGRYDFETRINGSTLVATGVQNFLANRPRRYRQTIVGAGFDRDDLVFRGTQKEIAFFAQDRFNISKSMKATAGLRYEAQINPQPTNPNPSIPQTARIPNDLKQFQPRLGLAWDVAEKGKTVVRLSAGLLTARTPANLFQRVFTDNGLVAREIEIAEPGACRNSTDPNRAGCLLRGPNAVLTYPNFLSALPPANSYLAARVFGFEPNFKNPRSFQTSATVEQQINKDYVMTIGYLRNATWNLQRRVDRNLFAPTINSFGMPIFPTTRPNPSIGVLSINESSAHSTYDAMTVSLRRRFSRRYQFDVNYTLANNRDDDSNERNFSQELALNPYDLTIEAGPSKQDVRHNLNASGVFDLGYGFTLSGIIITRTGFPFTPVVGDDTQNDGNTDNDRAIIDGRVVGRNSFRQPKFFNMDIRLLKAFKFSETKRLSISAEVFNVTRNTNKNYSNDAISIVGPGNVSASNIGEAFNAPLTSRFGGPRQLQLGARFSF
jgi:Carboxypeptidase regulatory-like domain